MSQRAARLLNYGLFQAAWFACVLGAAHGHALLGPAVVAAALAAQAPLVTERRREATLLLAVAALGLSLDTALAALGFVAYAASSFAPLAPAWIVALWAVFASTLTSSLAWLRRSRALAAVFGAAGGTASYLAGERLGAIEVLDPRGASLATLALAWALATVVACELAGRLVPVRREDGAAD